MADDSSAPPLTRRIPGAARGGPGSSSARPVLPDALLQRMQAAVDAARARQSERPDQAAFAKTGGAASQRAAAVAAEPRDRKSTRNPLRSPAGRRLAAPPARSGKPAPSRPSAGRPLPVQLWPPVETPPAQTPPPAQMPPVHTPAPAHPQPPAPAGPQVQFRQPVMGRAVPLQAPPRPTARRARRRGPWLAGVAALAVILTAAVTFALSSRSSARSPHSLQSQRPQSHSPQSQRPQSQSPPPPVNPAVTASLAAAWVPTQVGHDVVVACDKAMCDALAAHGFPGRHLRLIRPGPPAPPHAQVLVVTPLVQRQFGSSRIGNWAPAALASFGPASTGVSVRIVAPRGAAKFEAALKADQRSRKAKGAGLVNSPHVSTSATARKQLLTGQVDSRLIVVLTALASRHPIRILDFGAASPGASAGVPVRIAHLAIDYAAAGLSRSAYLRFLSKQLKLLPGIYKPPVAGLTTHDPAGALTFQIKFPAPSPLGVLGSQRP